MLALAGALSLAVLGASVAAGLATGDQASATIAAPTLKPASKVVKVKSTSKPPKSVKFNGRPVPGGVTTSADTATGGAGEVVIPGVPAYGWRDGCGPTAVGMVIGYYDNQGWDQLIPGDSLTDSAEVKQFIASHGTAASPGHYEDYSLPMDSSSTTILADRSAAPTGDEHAPNSLADLMHTSWSSDALRYGGSWSSMIGPGFSAYVLAKYPNTAPSGHTYAGTSLTWDLVKAEIGAGRPMVFLVDSSGDARTDHFVTVVGYRESNGYAEYACWDTWSTTLLRWQRFRAMSTEYTWGVWGGFTFAMGGASTQPSPTPEPTPSVTPPDSPTPGPSDTVAPVTLQSGADDLWHNTSVTVTFSATDDASGVAYTEYSLNGGAWTKGGAITITPPAKTAVAAIHAIQYRSADAAGNVESAAVAYVKIDTRKPITTSNVNSSSYKGSFTIRLTAVDPDSGVQATYVSVDGGAFKQATSATIAVAGRHTVRFYSVDAAGNIESAKSVSIRIK